MDAVQVLTELQEYGVSLTLEGDDIVASPASRIPDNLRPEIREHKSEIVEHLRHMPGQEECQPCTCNEDLVVEKQVVVLFRFEIGNRSLLFFSVGCFLWELRIQRGRTHCRKSRDRGKRASQKGAEAEDISQGNPVFQCLDGPASPKRQAALAAEMEAISS